MPSFDKDTKWYDYDLIKWNEEIFNYDKQTYWKLSGISLLFHHNYISKESEFKSWNEKSLWISLPHDDCFNPKRNCLIVKNNISIFLSKNYHVSDFFKDNINCNNKNNNNLTNDSKSVTNTCSEQVITKKIFDSVEKLFEEINDKNESIFNQILIKMERLAIENHYMNQRIHFLSSLYIVETKQQDNKKETNKKFQECIICLDLIADIIYFPCHHLCVCHKCNQKINYQKCSLCRSEITSIFHLKNSFQNCFVCNQKISDHIFDICKHVCLCQDCKKNNLNCPICFQKNNSLKKIWIN
jgi:hypothetical protein